MKRMNWMIGTVAVASLSLSLAEAKLELPRVFGDDMVVQRDKPVKVWVWGDKGDSITVGFNGQTKTTTVGDVWLCSGQSNMESAAGGIVDSDFDMPQAGIPAIGCLTIPLRSSFTPLDNFPVEERNPFYVELKGVWRVSSLETARDFPAVGYHFARLVNAITGVPIGLIDNSWGGTVVETWVSRASLEQIPEAQPLIKAFDAEAAAYDYEAELARRMAGWKTQAAKAEAAGGKLPPKPEVPKTYTYRQSYPGGCFNALIAPIRKFAIKGVIFYQGINNCVGGQGRPNLYMKTFPALIPDWRKAFNDPEMPFCIVQMTSFGGPDDENEPEPSMLHKASGVREAQLKAHLQYQNTGILLTFTKGSHPSSPYGMRVPPKGFVIAGKDRHFHPAKLDNEKADTFAVSSELVPEPVAVRYAWGVHPVANFGNRAAPAPPFRTDDWPAWNDAPIGPKGSPQELDPEVPTREAAEAQHGNARPRPPARF